MKKLNNCLHQCFRKIRIKDRENKVLSNLFNRRRSLRTKSDKGSKIELQHVEEELSNAVAEDNYIKIKNELKNIDGEEGGRNAEKLWKIKKET